MNSILNQTFIHSTKRQSRLFFIIQFKQFLTIDIDMKKSVNAIIYT